MLLVVVAILSCYTIRMSQTIDRALAAFARATKQQEFKHDDTTLFDEYRSQFHRTNSESPDGYVRDYNGRANRGQRS